MSEELDRIVQPARPVDAGKPETGEAKDIIQNSRRKWGIDSVQLADGWEWFIPDHE